MFKKCLPLLGALVVASPAFGITVNMDGFKLGAGDVVMTGTDGVSPSYSGQAGEFAGTAEGSLSGAQNLRFASLDAAAATSFVAWCAELTQVFSFGVTYQYDLVSGGSYFGAQKTANLSRLFTAAQGFVVDNFTSAAMQAAIWEVIYETDPTFNLTSGKFSGHAQTFAGQAAFDVVNGYLLRLGSYQASASISVLQNGDQQDFVIATIPEPETWLLFGVGLGAVGLMKRRQRRA